MDKPQVVVYAEKSLNYSPFDVKWLPCSSRLVSLGSHPRGTGALQVYQLSEGELEEVHSVERPKAIKCGTLGASGLEPRSLAVGDFEGQLEVVDLSRPQVPVYAVKAHTAIINSIDGVAGRSSGRGAPEIATGSRDGLVKVWDPRQKDRPVVTVEPRPGEGGRDCWSVALGDSHSPQDRALCAGFDNGDVKLLDLRVMRVVWETNLGNGVCSLQFDRPDIPMNKLLATTLESGLHVFDLRTLHPTQGYAGKRIRAHTSTVWCGRHLPQNRDLLATAGGDGSLALWKYCYPAARANKLQDGTQAGVAGSLQPLQQANVASQPITSMDWSPDKMGLCVCCGLDQALRVVIVTKLNLM